jgi:hypothetical protein
LPEQTTPQIGITKTSYPTTLTNGGGMVTYTYSVWNIGKRTALGSVAVTDDKCGPVTLQSGDLNNNFKIEANETWTYTCKVALSQTTTNTATAVAHSDDAYQTETIAKAVATVTVGGTPTVRPLIKITKNPSRTTPFPVGGGNVTYTYKVTNPGTVAIHNVAVTDNKCGPVDGRLGDVNNNDLLDTNETWVYTCQDKITTTTKNIATVTGDANGYTVAASAFATVNVATTTKVTPPVVNHPETTPGFPNTGYAPEGSDIPWNIITFTGLVLSISAYLIVSIFKSVV